MSDEIKKPELTHEFENYGCTIRHSFENDYAVLIDRDGREQEFQENQGMIAQGAPSATLLAIHAAKQDEQRRADEAAQERKDKQEAKRAADLKPPANGPRAPAEVADLVNQGDPTIVDSPLAPVVLPKPVPSTPKKKTGDK